MAGIVREEVDVIHLVIVALRESSSVYVQVASLHVVVYSSWALASSTLSAQAARTTKTNKNN